ncbi:MAG TPA: hypothetical protein VFU81_19780, partial [Thermomicrobiales bacterium]|nr:hypothetical protein [Thermomicrobiales bacterium]
MSDPVWPLLFASAILTPIAIVRHSWPLMTVAALLSLAFAFLLLPDGWLLLLLPCIQMAMAVLLRWEIPGFGHVFPIVFVGTLVWLAETNRLALVPYSLILG